MEVVVTVGAPEGAGVGQASVLGVAVRPLDARESGMLGLGAGSGLVVVGVDPRGPASGAIEENDVLLALDGKPITLARFKALDTRLSRGERATLVIQRGPDRFALRL